MTTKLTPVQKKLIKSAFKPCKKGAERGIIGRASATMATMESLVMKGVAEWQCREKGYERINILLEGDI